MLVPRLWGIAVADSHCRTSPAVAVSHPERFGKAERKRLNALLKQLPRSSVPSDSSCTSCLELIEQLRQEELVRSADPYNQAMRVCSGNLDIVERLFAEVAERKLTSEASYASLLAAQVEHGKIACAQATLDSMLVDASVPRPRLRTCAPLLRKLYESDEAVASEELWARLSRCGVEFSADEFNARISMHGRMGAAPALQQAILQLVTHQPTPDANSVATIASAVAICAAGATVQQTELDASGRCSCCSSQLRLLGLSAAERQQVCSVSVAHRP